MLVERVQKDVETQEGQIVSSKTIADKWFGRAVVR